MNFSFTGIAVRELIIRSNGWQHNKKVFPIWRLALLSPLVCLILCWNCKEKLVFDRSWVNRLSWKANFMSLQFMNICGIFILYSFFANCESLVTLCFVVAVAAVVIVVVVVIFCCFFFLFPVKFMTYKPLGSIRSFLYLGDIITQGRREGDPGRTLWALDIREYPLGKNQEREYEVLFTYNMTLVVKIPHFSFFI